MSEESPLTLDRLRQLLDQPADAADWLRDWGLEDTRRGHANLQGLATSGITPEEKAEKPARTHWDMLLERRSEKELEDILKERLELLRGGEIGPAHLHRSNAKRRVKSNV